MGLWGNEKKGAFILRITSCLAFGKLASGEVDGGS
jgi:hypothetical protein